MNANRQDGFAIDREIGVRLRLERQRLAMNQTEFAAIGGVTLGTQSRYESGGLPATEYLLRIGEAGADWQWVITGRRTVGTQLDDDAAALLSSFVELPREVRSLLVDHAQGLCKAFTAKTNAGLDR